MHFYLIKYEHLRDNYEETLEHIRKRFGLRRKNDTYNRIIKYKGTYNALYEKKPILLTDAQQRDIWSNINIKQENTLGYFVRTPERRSNAVDSVGVRGLSGDGPPS